MILAEDLRDSPTGIVLLSSGSKITEKTLRAIEQFNVQGRCLVYFADQNRTFTESSLKKIRQEKNKQIPVRIGKINLQAKKLYKDTYKTVKDFYNKSSMNKTVDLYEINKAAESIAAEITRSPQVLLQLAFLKTIDDYTFSHAVHVSIYVTALAKYINFPAKQLHEICLAGLLHDVGKVDIPLHIVNKPEKLSDEEFEVMKEHVRYSFNRVRDFSGVSKDMLNAILQHHERMDGSGYLEKLKGSEIHHWARLLAIADVYDAITTDRVYRNALLPHEGAEILMSNSGKLDIQYLNIFIRNMIFYPVGCKVVLSTGEIGTVISLHRNMPLRPLVQIVDKDSKKTHTINLVNNLTTFITDIIKE